MFFKKLEKWPAQSQIYAKRSKFGKKNNILQKIEIIGQTESKFKTNEI